MIKTCASCLHSESVYRSAIEYNKTCRDCHEVSYGSWSAWAEDTGRIEFTIRCNRCGKELPKMIGLMCRRCGSDDVSAIPEKAIKNGRLI